MTLVIPITCRRRNGHQLMKTFCRGRLVKISRNDTYFPFSLVVGECKSLL